MAAPFVPLEESLKTRRFTVEEFYQMSAAGILGPDHRGLELLNGLILEPMPAGSKHAGIVDFLAEFFGDRRQDRFRVRTQNPVRLSAFSEPLPDLALLKPRADFYRSSHPKAQDVILLVEVADSSLFLDLGEKARAYAVTGIGEYWVIDIGAEAMHVFRDPKGTEFRESAIARRGQSLSPAGLEDCQLAIADLLGPA